MKVIKINAMWCSACIIMNNVWKEVQKEYSFDTQELDYDFDEEEVSKYNVGKILPVFIFIKDDKEVLRLTGEYSKEEIIERISDINE